MATSVIAEAPILRIEPSKGWASLGLRDLWHYLELLYFLVWRDIKVRYKQTALGAAWAVLQRPLSESGWEAIVRRRTYRETQVFLFSK